MRATPGRRAASGQPLQVIAAAGSGKTEVVSQRVADFLADGVAPTGIVAFTFTTRAAAVLRNRIAERAQGRLDSAMLDQFGGLSRGPCLLVPAPAGADPAIRDRG